VGGPRGGLPTVNPDQRVADPVRRFVPSRMLLAPTGPVDRAQRNLTAMRVLDRTAAGETTDDDRRALGLWTGWGALPQPIRVPARRGSRSAGVLPNLGPAVPHPARPAALVVYGEALRLRAHEERRDVRVGLVALLSLILSTFWSFGRMATRCSRSSSPARSSNVSGNRWTSCLENSNRICPLVLRRHQRCDRLVNRLHAYRSIVDMEGQTALEENCKHRLMCSRVPS
jgi:hypothetical protein